MSQNRLHIFTMYEELITSANHNIEKVCRFVTVRTRHEQKTLDFLNKQTIAMEIKPASFCHIATD